MFSITVAFAAIMTLGLGSEELGIGRPSSCKLQCLAVVTFLVIPVGEIGLYEMWF